MKKWVSKVALVTGASSGLGKDISLRLIEHGLRVVGCGRNFDNLQKVKSEVPKDAKGDFTPFKCDVSKEEDILRLFNFLKDNFKGLSVLINSAGFSSDGSILHGKTENWKMMFETNVLGTCICTREAYSMMRESEKSKDIQDQVPGHIINISSILGHLVMPLSAMHFYMATKFAVTALTEGIRQELREAESKIRVTQISPGYVDTEFAKRASEDLEKKWKETMPQALQASDISDAIIFTLSAPPRSAVHDIIVRPTIQTA